MRIVRFLPLGLTLSAIALITAAAVGLARIDTDITRSLPQGDPVLADAAHIFTRHPIQDQMVIDLGIEREDTDFLAARGADVEKMLTGSGLFRQVGMADVAARIPELLTEIPDRLPVLFSARQLDAEIAPRLSPDRVKERIMAIRDGLLDLQGIGQAALLAKDPLGFREPVMARLAHLAPTLNVRIHRGMLLSADGRHLLIPATPAASGTDTAAARDLDGLMARLSESLEPKAAAAGHRLTLTPMGAFRAALDNERIARRDVSRALVLATLAIALLLVFAFPRPSVGLLAFLPALAGTSAAFFVCALVFRNLSIMAVGFGGAIISITMDHGIAYLLFLDQPRQTRGLDAAREVEAVGLLTALTNVGAFGVLCSSGFLIFQQLGLFSALGVAFSFLFIHWVFPWVLPGMPPARSRPLPLRRLVDRLTSAGRPGMWLAFGFGGVMLFFARPVFNVDLGAMNTVSPETAAAEALVRKTWGSDVDGIVRMNLVDFLLDETALP